MHLTKQNVEQYVGKTLYCNSKGWFHHYPLTVKQRKDGSYCYIDRVGTAMQVPDESDKFNSVYFDYAENTDSAPEQDIVDEGPIKPDILPEV